jgi:pimeloyl-ACP methyl ester carboxylesterase
MQKDWTQGTIQTPAGIELFYTRTGGSQRPIVLAHGITDMGLCWHQLAADLAADYDLIMYDAYGHGQSSRIDPEIRFDLAEDLNDLIEALKLDQPVVLGHSMGADTAANFAARYPDRISALLLEDPPWSDQVIPEKTLTETMQTWKKRNLSAKEKSLKDLIKLKKKEAPSWEESILEPWAEAKHTVDPAIFDQYPVNRTPWRDLARKITVPTLLITGDNALGAIVTPELGIEAVKILEDGEFGHISHAGHCVRYEQYAPYLTMVKLFLKQNL